MTEMFERISRSYSVFKRKKSGVFLILAFSPVFSVLKADFKDFTYRPEYHGSWLLFSPMSEQDTATQEWSQGKFPARGLLMSLAIPGWGQWYAGSKVKALAFVAVEAAGWGVWSQFQRKGEDKRIEFQNYVNDHWDLYRWWEQINYFQDTKREDPKWKPEYYSDVVIDGTHDLKLILPDGSFGTSDTLDWDGWTSEEKQNMKQNMDVIRDHEFYENVGKYDQFVTGWDDLGSADYQPEQKIRKGENEYILMTPNKNSYLHLRADHNRLLQWAGYSISAVMFNHVISGFHAFYEIWKKSTPDDKAEHQVQTSAKLLFSPYHRWGVGGIQLTVHW